MGKNLFNKLSNNHAIPKSSPFSLHHPDASLCPVNYYLPHILRDYTAVFPRRLKKLLQSTSPDKFNDDMLTGEIGAFLRAAQEDLILQWDDHQHTIQSIRKKNTASLLELNAQIEEVDRQIGDIDKLLDSLK